MRVLYFVAHGFAATLDWVMGVFIVWALGQLWPHELAWYHYALGALLGIAPDFDLLHQLLFLKKGEGLTDHHDWLTHRPAFMLPLAAGLGYLLGGEFWAVVAALPIFAHYLHDTRGLGGGGIGWLWPFSKMHYGLSLKKGILVTHPSEAKALWPDHNQWLEKEYLRPSRRSERELSISAFLLAVVVSETVDNVDIGIGVGILVFAVVTVLWYVFERMKKLQKT